MTEQICNSDKTQKLLIREVRLADAKRLSEIYSYYVSDTAVSFEYEPPTEEEFVRRISSITEKYPYIVCEYEGIIVGYAYASAYSTREAYNWTAGTSIYIDKNYRRLGAGALLYTELEARAKEIGIVNFLAGIAFVEQEDAYLTHDSIKFHTKVGYSKVAHMIKVGKKFDRWYDLIWMQKVL